MNIDVYLCSPTYTELPTYIYIVVNKNYYFGVVVGQEDCAQQQSSVQYHCSGHTHGRHGDGPAVADADAHSASGGDGAWA